VIIAQIKIVIVIIKHLANVLQIASADAKQLVKMLIVLVNVIRVKNAHALINVVALAIKNAIKIVHADVTTEKNALAKKIALKDANFKKKLANAVKDVLANHVNFYSLRKNVIVIAKVLKNK